jgi:hypothetical protein
MGYGKRNEHDLGTEWVVANIWPCQPHKENRGVFLFVHQEIAFMDSLGIK